MKSPAYFHPAIYDVAIQFLYFDGLKLLNKLVGTNKSVFEAACGYGRMQRYLDPTCSYYGIDLNEQFIAYGRKKKLDIAVGNALDSTQYRHSDVVLLADILHHLPINDMIRLFNIAARFAREKIVIIEPAFVSLASKRNIFSRLLGKFMIAMDLDGFNQISRWLSSDEYHRLFHIMKKENNIKDMKITRHRNHHFVEMHL